MNLEDLSYACRRAVALTAAAGAAAATDGACAQSIYAGGTTALEEIIVTSSRIEEPRREIGTAVAVLTAEEMALRGYVSIADVLRTQPGIGVSNSGGPGKTTVLRIRGEEGFRTLLLVDGIKTVDPTAPQVGPGFASVLSTSEMERVEIMRGPQGFAYGADAGGVVNVLTRAGSGATETRLGIESGAFDTEQLSASIAGGSNAGDYYVSLTDFSTSGFNARSDDAVLRDDDGAQNTTLHAKLGWNARENLRLQFVARDVDATTSFDNCFDPATFVTSNNCVGINEQQIAKLSGDLATGEFRHAFGYSKAETSRTDFANDMTGFTTAGDVSRLEYTGRYTGAEAGTLIYGLDLQSERITSGDISKRDQDGYYIEYQHSFRDRLFLAAGIRHDSNNDFGHHTSTRLSGAYVADLAGGAAVKYRASLGNGFRAPSLYEAAYNAGPFGFLPAAGVTLIEESSEGFDLGIEYHTLNGLRLELTYFDQNIRDEIYFDLIGFSGYLQASGKTASTGLEFAASVPAGDRFQFIGNWTLNDTADMANAPRLRRPDSMGNLGIVYRSNDGQLRLIGNYRYSGETTDVGAVRLEAYSVLDFSVVYRLNETLELHGRLENAADTKYQELAGFNTAGRSAYLGATISF